MSKLAKTDKVFLFLIGSFLFWAGFIGYQHVDKYIISRQIVRDSDIVSVDNEGVHSQKTEAESFLFRTDGEPYPVTNNLWSDGAYSYYYLGNRLIQVRDFRFNYEGLDDYIYIDGVEQDDDVIRAFKKMMRYVPENVLNEYIESGGRFIFCNEKSMFENYKILYEDERTAWNDFYDEKYTIDAFICYNDEDYRICCRNNIDSVIRSSIHELGHYVDRHCGEENQLISLSDEFIKIYDAEAGNSDLADYALGEYDEYFAESFQQMLVDPTYCDRCPQTCRFIERCYRGL